LAAIFAVYAAVLIGIGIVFRGSVRTREQTYLAGRRLSSPIVAVSLSATAIGGSATVALASYVHGHGLVGVWLDLPLGLALVVGGLFLARRIRATGCMSLPQVGGRLYGDGFRLAVAALVAMAEVAWFALLLRAAAPFLHGITALPESACMVVIAMIFLCYTLMGGQAAVAWTDLLQLLLILGAGLILPALAVMRRTDWLSGLPDGSLCFPTGCGLNLPAVAGLLAMIGLPGLVGGDVYSKILSARDVSTARRGTLAAGVIKILSTALIAVIALGGRILLPQSGGDGLLADVIETVMSPWLASLAFLAFLAAMMSSADSVLLTGTTIVDVDLVPGSGSRVSHRVRYAITASALGAAGLMLAVISTGIVELLKWAYTVFAAGAPLPVLTGLLSKKPLEGPWPVASLLGGGGTAVAAKLAGAQQAVLYGLLVSALLLIYGTFIKK
jgi:SSS family solute:Na+ symporter